MASRAGGAHGSFGPCSRAACLWRNRPLLNCLILPIRHPATFSILSLPRDESRGFCEVEMMPSRRSLSGALALWLRRLRPRGRVCLFDGRPALAWRWGIPPRSRVHVARSMPPVAAAVSQPECRCGIPEHRACRQSPTPEGAGFPVAILVSRRRTKQHPRADERTCDARPPGAWTRPPRWSQRIPLVCSKPSGVAPRLVGDRSEKLAVSHHRAEDGGQLPSGALLNKCSARRPHHPAAPFAFASATARHTIRAARERGRDSAREAAPRCASVDSGW